MAYPDHGGSHRESHQLTDSFLNVICLCIARILTLRFSRFRILCSITTSTWRKGSKVSVEACFSSLGLAEGILHGQQTRTGNRNSNRAAGYKVRGAGYSSAHAHCVIPNLYASTVTISSPYPFLIIIRITNCDKKNITNIYLINIIFSLKYKPVHYISFL